MELPAGVNRRYASIAIFLLATVWVWVAFDRPYKFPSHIPWNIYSNAPQTEHASDIFDYPPLNSPAIKKLCASTQWNTSVVFTCQAPSGGVAEVRNSLLGCVRFAMAAGGSLIVPRIVVNDDYGDTVAGNTTDLGYMFDTEHFVASLGISCPQMRIYNTGIGIEDAENANGPLLLQPESLLSMEASGEHFAEEWRAAFYKWLSQYLVADSWGPVVIRVGDSYLKYPIATDRADFQQHFGKILKIRADIRRFSTMVLQKLSGLFDAPLNLKELRLKNILLGVYFSTEADTKTLPIADHENSNYEAQSKLFLGHAMRGNLSVIYVASAHGPEISRFILDANAAEVEATSKLDLLKGKDREDLLDLTLDQQPIVDFLVMTKVSDFVGMGYDPFAWSVALRRHEFLKKGEGLDWLQGEQVAQDAFSTLIGAISGHGKFATSIWP
ncbi:hypothetical protein BKA65DRAFT_101762 [Rhexocercosporidium sp. MPI-PUGE-AT-0058]|nr:hypothetical protein BKA65DRAFT_101762 [Rhexocercosporidium sp. MPI-PUGE-AT-0058]